MRVWKPAMILFSEMRLRPLQEVLQVEVLQRGARLQRPQDLGEDEAGVGEGQGGEGGRRRHG